MQSTATAALTNTHTHTFHITNLNMDQFATFRVHQCAVIQGCTQKPTIL